MIVQQESFKISCKYMVHKESKNKMGHTRDRIRRRNKEKDKTINVVPLFPNQSR